MPRCDPLADLMPRQPRFNLVGVAQHVVQRGNNRCACFFADNDYGAYLAWLSESAAFHGVAVHAYVLMTNHVHLLVTPSASGAVSAMMQTLARRYVPYINRKYSRSGTLWEGRFRACIVDTERYMVTAYRYIDLNPVRAGIVSEPGAHRWSSYAANAGLRVDRLISPHECYLALGPSPAERAERYRALCGEIIDPRELADLRATTRKELAFGSEGFKDGIEARAGRRTRPVVRSVARAKPRRVLAPR